MSATPIQNALPGEDLIGIEPELRQQVDPGWLHRLALFNGRTLTESALKTEQAYRAGRLAILGQCVTHGAVKGLEFSADLTAPDPLLQVSPGYGISAAGEDVALTRTLRTTLGSLFVIDPKDGSFIDTFPNYRTNPSNTAFAGVFLLQPVTGQVSASAVNTGAAPIIVSGNLEASCDQDPEEFAFSDFQIVDGVRLVMVAWPTSFPKLALPAPTPDESLRNRLAYTVFEAEMALTADDRLPWDLLGVTVALVAFDSAWKPRFTDRYAVVRGGGLARKRCLLPVKPGSPGTPLLIQPALAQARVFQLTDQLAAESSLVNFIPKFAFLPPCGVVPASALDFTNQVALWFPPGWTVNVGPIHDEEIETVLLTGMTALPLDVTRSESVEVLIPLPDALFDPNILVQEKVDPAFNQAVADATKELSGVLQHRKAIQQEANALSVALTGTQQPPLYDLDAGLTANEKSLRDAAVYTPPAGETFSTSSTSTGYVSQDIEKLIADSKKPPYTLVVDGNGNPLPKPLPLFKDADMADMAQNGLQHFIDLIKRKVSRANDLLDLAFLTTQADIYRFRQYVLKSSDATALAVSPIVAQIATGESAAVTASNLQTYLSSILPSNSPPTPPTTTTPPPGAAPGGTFNTATLLGRKILASPQPFSTFSSPTLLRPSETVTRTGIGAIGRSTAGGTVGTVFGRGAGSASGAFLTEASSGVLADFNFVPSTPGSVAQPATPGDVTSQSPIVGAQLNLRTLTIAKRLQNPPSQEGLFYATGNRVALLQLLAELEIMIDDLPILVDTPPPPATTTTAAPGTTGSPIAMPILADLRDLNRRGAVLNAVLTPAIPAPRNTDPDEASLFSTGIHVLEQHSSLLRAVEARIQQYNDFVTDCNAALGRIKAVLPQAQALVSQLDNALAQARQDVAFTTALLKDEGDRVTAVNAERARILQNEVHTLVYTRPRTLQTQADVPSRQLVPGNIASPVPSCLQQSVAIPPELREVVSLLREAPVRWMPSIQNLLNKLERPNLLQILAVDAQARAAMLVQLTPRPSSAASQPGLYAPVIANIFDSHQQAFTAVQMQRSVFQPVQLVNQSWNSQIQILQDIVAAGDLLSSAAVHAEVVNATSQLIRQISNVATCLYARAAQALPIRRLAWAEFLRGPGLNIQLQSLAVLPTFNTEDYIPRQQMQMLVDWLFQQIDTTIPRAVAFMSDVVRVAILLASDAPVNDVIGGAVTLATTPVVGGLVSLTLPSQRIAHGMYVQLYSGGVLAAQAVVTDLDTTTVRATVTQVYQPGVSLRANDVAHFTAQVPQALALQPFDM